MADNIDRPHHRTSATVEALSDWVVKDSGKRHTFEGGMVRDTQENKVDWWRILIGPMMERYAIHLTKGNAKYPDVNPGIPNWTMAQGPEERERFKQSAMRHFVQWMRGDQDEDHAAAVLFNINGYEYVKEKLGKLEFVKSKCMTCNSTTYVHPGAVGHVCSNCINKGMP